MMTFISEFIQILGRLWWIVASRVQPFVAAKGRGNKLVVATVGTISVAGQPALMIDAGTETEESHFPRRLETVFPSLTFSEVFELCRVTLPGETLRMARQRTEEKRRRRNPFHVAQDPSPELLAEPRKKAERIGHAQDCPDEAPVISKVSSVPVSRLPGGYNFPEADKEMLDVEEESVVDLPEVDEDMPSASSSDAGEDYMVDLPARIVTRRVVIVRRLVAE